MIEHLAGDPSAAELGHECGLSRGYFTRAFRVSTGASPHQWLLRQRIERARQLLRQSHASLADVATACGFVDQSHFTRVFTRIVGQSPGRWRRELGSTAAP